MGLSETDILRDNDELMDLISKIVEEIDLEYPKNKRLSTKYLELSLLSCIHHDTYTIKYRKNEFKRLIK